MVWQRNRESCLTISRCFRYAICMNDQTNTPAKSGWTHQADNRARLIEAGYGILSEKGFEATTVKEIARRASVSPGLFHYYFASKDELLFAVLKEAGERFFGQELAQELQQRLAEQPFAETAMLTMAEISRKNPTWYRLRYEFYALGLRNPAFLPSVGAFLEKGRQAIARTLRSHLTDKSEEEIQALAAVIHAVSDGLALQQIAQSSVDFTAAYRLIQDHLLRESSSP